MEKERKNDPNVFSALSAPKYSMNTEGKIINSLKRKFFNGVKDGVLKEILEFVIISYVKAKKQYKGSLISFWEVKELGETTTALG